MKSSRFDIRYTSSKEIENNIKSLFTVKTLRSKCNLFLYKMIELKTFDDVAILQKECGGYPLKISFLSGLENYTGDLTGLIEIEDEFFTPKT